MTDEIAGLCGFLNEAHSVYHAQRAVARRLEKAGYVRLAEQDVWNLSPGGRYYVTRGDASGIAFRIPEGDAAGFLISDSHCDRPSWKVKGELKGAYTRLSTEPYGGAIWSTWLDRPLSIAGRISVATADGIRTKLIDLDRDLLVIPSVAIHMNRQVNEGYKWNPAVDLIPLIGGQDAAGKLTQLLEREAGGEILGHDLYLYIRQPASVWGVDEDMVSAAALDDLECVWGCTRGFLESGTGASIPVLCVQDSEEIGSCSPQGAASTFLTDTLGRISACLGRNYPELLAQSFMISADNAHALHPNHPEYADPSNAPVMGGGVVLKNCARLSYCTDGVSAALIRTFARRGNVPVQSFFNRADLRGGSTLGHISLSHVSIPTADIGLAQLAMHSCFETASAKDAAALVQLMKTYYGSTLRRTSDGYQIL